MIVGLIGYDSIRKHLAACGYYTAEIREKYYLRIADAYIDIKEQRGQYWLENIMKDRFAVSMFGQKRLSREGGIEIVVKELCTRMARDGCQVTCYNRSGHHVSGAEYDNKIEYDGIRQKFVPTIERKGLAAVSSSFFAALYSAFGKYDVVHINTSFLHIFFVVGFHEIATGITVNSRLNNTKSLNATYIFLNFNLSHLLYLLLLLDFFQVSAQCILPSRKRSKACLHQLALIQTTIERTSSFAQTILRRGHWQDFRLPSSLTVDFFVKSYQLM